MSQSQQNVNSLINNSSKQVQSNIVSGIPQLNTSQQKNNDEKNQEQPVVAHSAINIKEPVKGRKRQMSLSGQLIVQYDNDQELTILSIFSCKLTLNVPFKQKIIDFALKDNLLAVILQDSTFLIFSIQLQKSLEFDPPQKIYEQKIYDDANLKLDEQNPSEIVWRNEKSLIVSNQKDIILINLKQDESESPKFNYKIWTLENQIKSIDIFQGGLTVMALLANGTIINLNIEEQQEIKNFPQIENIISLKCYFYNSTYKFMITLTSKGSLQVWLKKCKEPQGFCLIQDVELKFESESQNFIQFDYSKNYLIVLNYINQISKTAFVYQINPIYLKDQLESQEMVASDFFLKNPFLNTFRQYQLYNKTFPTEQMEVICIPKSIQILLKQKTHNFDLDLISKQNYDNNFHLCFIDYTASKKLNTFYILTDDFNNTKQQIKIDLTQIPKHLLCFLPYIQNSNSNSNSNQANNNKPNNQPPQQQEEKKQKPQQQKNSKKKQENKTDASSNPDKELDEDDQATIEEMKKFMEKLFHNQIQQVEKIIAESQNKFKEKLQEEISEKQKIFKEQNNQILEKQTSAFSDKIVYECKSEFLEIFKKTKKNLEEGVAFYKSNSSNQSQEWTDMTNLNKNIKQLQDKLTELKENQQNGNNIYNNGLKNPNVIQELVDLKDQIQVLVQNNLETQKQENLIKKLKNCQKSQKDIIANIEKLMERQQKYLFDEEIPPYKEDQQNTISNSNISSNNLDKTQEPISQTSPIIQQQQMQNPNYRQNFQNNNYTQNSNQFKNSNLPYQQNSFNSNSQQDYKKKYQ